tara:strand:- start:433 stop:735 length:303 start_codon:yes stop_codon:yes gene_type:complete
MKEKLRTIDLTPSWSGITPLLVHIASHGASHEGRKAALAEIMRMAEIVDSLQGAAEECLPDNTAAPRKSELAMSMAQEAIEEEEPWMIDTSASRRAEEIG